MISRIASKLCIKEACIINTPIYKKAFYENTHMNKRDKDIFIKQIEKLTLLYSFSESTINIRPYKDNEREYEEIAVILVDVVEDAKTNRIEEIIQQDIPYPIVLIFSSSNRIKINLAQKRTNKADDSKNTIEESMSTHWIDLDNLSQIEVEFIESLITKELNFSNCYNLYSDICFRVMLLNLSTYTKKYKEYINKDPVELEEGYNQLKDLDKTIETLRNDLKKEQQINRQIKLNIKIKNLLRNKENIIQLI